MITRAEARGKIIRAWRTWDGEKSKPPTDKQMLMFYEWLRQNQPEMLEFRRRGDLWQTVHAWLLEYQRALGMRVSRGGGVRH